MIHALLGLAPLVALIALLALGRYPGEAALDAARNRRGPQRPRRPPVADATLPLPRRPLPRGGALLARRLAGRAPPSMRWTTT